MFHKGILVFFIFIKYIYSASEECIDTIPTYQSCVAVKNTSDDYSCCYFTSKINGKDSAACIRIKKDLKIIKEKISSVQEISTYSYEDVNIKCCSFYQFFNIYILLYLLLFLFL